MVIETQTYQSSGSYSQEIPSSILKETTFLLLIWIP